MIGVSRAAAAAAVIRGSGAAHREREFDGVAVRVQRDGSSRHGEKATTTAPPRRRMRHLDRQGTQGC